MPSFSLDFYLTRDADLEIEYDKLSFDAKS